MIGIFACSVLLLAGSDPQCTVLGRVGEGTNQKIASLMWSVFAVPEPPFKRAAHFLDWLHQNAADEEMRVFALLGLLMVEAGRGGAAQCLDEIAGALVEVEASLRSNPDLFHNDQAWRGRFVLGLTGYDLHHRLWVELARRVLEKHPVRMGEATAARTALERVVGE